MKKKSLALLLGISMVLSSSSFVFAATDAEESGDINLDSHIAAYQNTIYDDETITIFSSLKLRAAAGGGDFWVEYGAEKHWALFDHASKVHRTSAGNSNGSTRGEWVNAGTRASTWTYSTISGNTANWSTK